MSLSDTLTATRAITIDADTGDRLVPITTIAKEFDRNRRTLARWIGDEALGFPTPVRINGRLYVSRRAIEAWKRDQIDASVGGLAA